MTGYRYIWLILYVFLAAALTSCGSGTSVVDSGSGESGVGGTGISFVRGQIASVDGAAGGSQPVTISAGGQTTTVDPDGSFELENVPVAGMRLVLSFSNGSGRSVVLTVEPVEPGVGVTIKDIRIDFPQGLVEAGQIVFQSAVVTETPVDDSASSGDVVAASQNPDTGEETDSGDTGDIDDAGAKVTICHFPGKPAEITLVVSEESLPGHLGHGDTEGPCP